MSQEPTQEAPKHDIGAQARSQYKEMLEIQLLEKQVELAEQEQQANEHFKKMRELREHSPARCTSCEAQASITEILLYLLFFGIIAYMAYKANRYA